MTLYQDTRERVGIMNCQIASLVKTVYTTDPAKFDWQGTELKTWGRRRAYYAQRITSWRTKKTEAQKPLPPRAILSGNVIIRRNQLAVLRKQGEERRAAFERLKPDPFKQWYRRALELHKRKVNRLLNPNPCSIWCREVTSVPNQLLTFEVARYGMGGYSLSGDICLRGALNKSPFLPVNRYYLNLSNDTNVKYHVNRALVKTYAKLKAPDMPGLVYLGELMETLRMLRNPLSGLRGFFDLFQKKLKHVKPAQVAKATADQWLEYRYGIMPLIYQIQEIRDAFEKTVVLGYPVRMVRSGVVLKPTTVSSVLEDANVGGYYYGRIFVTDTVKESGHCSLATTLQLDESRFLGLSWLDIPAAIWELIPSSFVLDWFFNIGDWIQAITPNPMLQVKASSVSVVQEHKVDYEIGALSWQLTYPIYKYYVASGCRLTEKLLTRVVNPALPALPVGNRDFLKFKRILDSIALLYGQTSRLLRR